MKLRDRLKAIREGVDDIFAAVEQIVEEMELENRALRQENRVLEGRLQETRRMLPPLEPVPVKDDPLLIPAADDPRKRCRLTCRKCHKGFWARTLVAKFCPGCKSEDATEREMSKREAREAQAVEGRL